MIIYDKLWETMKDRNISQYKLIHTYGISPSQLTRLKRNERVVLSMLHDVLLRLLPSTINLKEKIQISLISVFFVYR